MKLFSNLNRTVINESLLGSCHLPGEDGVNGVKKILLGISWEANSISQFESKMPFSSTNSNQLACVLVSRILDVKRMPEVLSAIKLIQPPRFMEKRPRVICDLLSQPRSAKKTPLGSNQMVLPHKLVGLVLLRRYFPGFHFTWALSIVSWNTIPNKSKRRLNGNDMAINYRISKIRCCKRRSGTSVRRSNSIKRRTSASSIPSYRTC